MDVRIHDTPDRVVVEPHGPLTHTTLYAFERETADLPRDRPISIDHTHVTALDSAALGELIVLRELATADDPIVIIAGSPENRRVLEQSRFQDLFDLR